MSQAVTCFRLHGTGRAAHTVGQPPAHSWRPTGRAQPRGNAQARQLRAPISNRLKGGRHRLWPQSQLSQAGAGVGHKDNKTDLCISRWTKLVLLLKIKLVVSGGNVWQTPGLCHTQVCGR